MATGASNSELAVILIDARKGVLVQTRRHAFIASLLDIRHVVLAVNKIDLVGHSRAVFRTSRVTSCVRGAARFCVARADPDVRALRRQRDVRSERTPWYHGPTLLEHLDTVDVETEL